MPSTSSHELTVSAACRTDWREERSSCRLRIWRVGWEERREEAVTESLEGERPARMRRRGECGAMAAASEEPMEDGDGPVMRIVREEMWGERVVAREEAVVWASRGKGAMVGC